MWQRSLMITKCLNGALSITNPVIVGFLAMRGISDTDFTHLKAWFCIVGCAFEIPFGFFSDLLGRRRALVCSGVLNMLSATIYLTGTSNYLYFLLAEVLRAIGMAFLSGTDEALAAEKLGGKTKEFKAFWAKAQWFESISVGVFWGIGFGGVAFGTTWLFYAAAVLHALQAIVALFLPESTRHEYGSWSEMWAELRLITVQYLFRKGEMRRLMLYGAIILGIGKLGPLLIERVMKSKMSVVEYSVAGTALLAVMLVIGIKTKDLAKPQSLPLFGVLMVYAWTGLSVFNVGIAGGVFVAAVIVLLQLSMSATSFGMNELLKKDEKYRATILSYRGGMDRLVGVGAWLIIGHIGIGDGSLILASFLLIIVVLIMKKG